MAVIPCDCGYSSLHSGQTEVYVAYTTGGAFDLYSSHSTSGYNFTPRAVPLIRMAAIVQSSSEIHIRFCQTFGGGGST